MRNTLMEKRVLAGLARMELAKHLRVSESTIRKVEIGERNPSVPLAYRWAKKLRIPKKDFFSIFFNYKADNM